MLAPCFRNPPQHGAPPLLVGLDDRGRSGGYLGWQHFAHSPSAAKPEPPPPVPVIATTVQQQDFPIVLTGIGNVTALNTATVRSMVTEQIVSIDFKDGQFVKKGELLAQLDPSTFQAQLDQAEANLARDQAHLENAQINLEPVCPAGKARLCTGAAGRHAAGDDRPAAGHDQGRSGGDRICQDPAELYQAGGAVRRGRRNSPARCREHHPREHDAGFSERAERLGRRQPGAADQRDGYVGCSRHSEGAGRSRKGLRQGHCT